MSNCLLEALVLWYYFGGRIGILTWDVFPPTSWSTRSIWLSTTESKTAGRGGRGSILEESSEPVMSGHPRWDQQGGLVCIR